MKISKYLGIVGILLSLTACNVIETGNAGVRTGFTGSVNMVELEQGFYTSFVSNIDTFTTKEVAVTLQDLTPKAKDDLSLADLDVDIYYTVEKGDIAELMVKYQNSHAYDDGIYYPAFKLVKSVSRGSAYAATSEYDSLTIHTQRDLLADKIKKYTEKSLEVTDPGVFKITRVIIRSILPDPSIEDNIKKVVAKEKELEAKKLEVEIANTQKVINNAITASLSPNILRQLELEVIREACKIGTCIMSLNDTNVQPLIQVKQ